ncbi:MAG: hypothetical protein IJF65_06095 [Clostridia bacterium]|nr:hypothetical protein [Clostridia bacterium]
MRDPLRRGILINLFYGLLKLGAGLVYPSPWLFSLAGYYFLQTGLRWILILSRPSPWRRCRLCGLTLIVMHAALAVVVYQMVREQNAFHYPGFLIYGAAAYTFYSLITALVSALKVKRADGPITGAARTVTLSGAMVSLLALETGLLSQFGQPGQETFRQIMIALTGAAVCLSILWMAGVMIKRANAALKLGKGSCARPELDEKADESA